MSGVLVFDGDCAFCTRSAGLARRLPGRATVVPYQRADLPALGLTAEQCAQAVQFVPAGGGPALSGAPAVAGLLVASGAPWSWAGRAMRLPGVRQLADRVYHLVAANRSRLPGGTPACALPPPD